MWHTPKGPVYMHARGFGVLGSCEWDIVVVLQGCVHGKMMKITVVYVIYAKREGNLQKHIPTTVKEEVWVPIPTVLGQTP
jgi:hypothetical protein